MGKSSNGVRHKPRRPKGKFQERNENGSEATQEMAAQKEPTYAEVSDVYQPSPPPVPPPRATAAPSKPQTDTSPVRTKQTFSETISYSVGKDNNIIRSGKTKKPNFFERRRARRLMKNVGKDIGKKLMSGDNSSDPSGNMIQSIDLDDQNTAEYNIASSGNRTSLYYSAGGVYYYAQIKKGRVDVVCTDGNNQITLRTLKLSSSGITTGTAVTTEDDKWINILGQILGQKSVQELNIQHITDLKSAISTTFTEQTAPALARETAMNSTSGTGNNGGSDSSEYAEINDVEAAPVLPARERPVHGPLPENYNGPSDTEQKRMLEGTTHASQSSAPEGSRTHGQSKSLFDTGAETKVSSLVQMFESKIKEQKPKKRTPPQTKPKPKSKPKPKPKG